MNKAKATKATPKQKEDKLKKLVTLHDLATETGLSLNQKSWISKVKECVK